MARNVQFSILFGLIFYVVLALALVPDSIATYVESLWLAPALVVGFFGLRYLTILGEKANAAGARAVDRMLPNPEEQQDEAASEPQAETPAEPTQETFVQMLTGLILVGPWITLGLALAALVAGMALVEAIPGTAEWSEDKQLGLMLVLGGICSIPWLIALQWWGGVRINLPIIPIPLLWLTPVAIVGGLYLFFTAVEPVIEEAPPTRTKSAWLASNPTELGA